eukprot:6178292-Pleurochrysis_carterae.AAC.2
MDIPRLTARAARVRREVARIVAQKPHKGTPGGDGGTVDEFPAVVAGVVRNFCSFRDCPARTVITQRLFAILGIGTSSGCEKRGIVAPFPVDTRAYAANRE